MATPERIDCYTVRRSLGEGDFARTYLCELDGTQVAVKLARTTDGDASERLRNEIAVLPLFEHPGIPRYVGSGRWNGRPYLAMEVAKGRTLREVWKQRKASNGRLSDLQVLIIIREVLETLGYMHTLKRETGEGWVHRDIKDANIIVDAEYSNSKVIDFGFCKEDGARELRLSDSFFRAGAARYAPPSKLEYPTIAVANHDVFAVGVLAFQLLTNEFPWSVRDADSGSLLDAMRATEPPLATVLNSTVRQEVAQLIRKLLEPKDAYRPAAADAAAECQNLIEEFKRGPRRDTMRPPKFDQVWRDPIYGDVRLTEFERRVIDTPQMQRLREIKQLGLSYYVYDGARHSRLGHAVGSVHQVEQILNSIEMLNGEKFEQETRQVARLYALVHDVTHIPFGHTLEDEYQFFVRHDDNAERIERLLLNASLGNLLRQHEAGREVLRHFDQTASLRRRSDIEDLVSGPVGADVLDYIDRDAFFCGLSHRVDSALVRQLRMHTSRGTPDSRLVSTIGGHYGLRADREFAVESLFTERYAMFLKVYANKTKIRASAMLAKALSLCLYASRHPGLEEPEIEQMGDTELLNRIAVARTGNIQESCIIADLKERKLPRAVYRAAVMKEGDLRDAHLRRAASARLREDLSLFPAMNRLQVEEKLAREAGLRGDQVMVYVTPDPPGLKDKQRHQFLIDKNGQAEEPNTNWFAEIQARHTKLWDFWVFVSSGTPADGAERLSDAAAAFFCQANRIATPPRADALF